MLDDLVLTSIKKQGKEMNISIVEDCKEHSEMIRHYIEEWGIERGEKVFVSQFADGEKFLFHNEDTNNIDAIFMDIQMPGISGVELARKIRERNQEIAIVFTTGIDDYIEEGYELEATHYLMKPVSADKVRLCLDKVAKKEKKKEKYIVLNGDEGAFRIAVSSIWWVSAMGHNVILGIEDNQHSVKRVTARNSMGELEKELLKDNSFQKTHRSYIVNLRFVKSITKTDIIMDNGDKIPLSRRMYRNVNESFIQFFTGK